LIRRYPSQIPAVIRNRCEKRYCMNLIGARLRKGLQTHRFMQVEAGNVLGLFKQSPLKRWQKEHESLAYRAFQAQRNGDIRLYSTLTAEAEALREKIEKLQEGDAE
jgi:hypothetical protein